MDHINTKLHRLIEACRHGYIYIIKSNTEASKAHTIGEFDLKRFAETVKPQLNEPVHYVIDKSAFKVLETMDTRACLHAMRVSGKLALPHESMIVEIPFNQTSDDQTFVLLSNWPDIPGTYLAQCFHLVTPRKGVTHDSCATYVQVTQLDMQEQGSVFYKQTPHLFMSDSQDVRGYAKDTAEELVRHVGNGLTAVLIFLNTRGIVRERVLAPAKLNKARAARKLPLIPDYVTIRIGSYTDKAGVEHAYDSRKSPRLHWRRPYSRRQHYGKGRAMVYEVDIEACLVNFEPGDTVPAKPKNYVIK